uniref:Fibroblast growth factor n=2 Tax=Passeriformes TaxID=9126 RepID=A0A8C3MCJ5_GEOPR
MLTTQKRPSHVPGVSHRTLRTVGRPGPAPSAHSRRVPLSWCPCRPSMPPRSAAVPPVPVPAHRAPSARPGPSAPPAASAATSPVPPGPAGGPPRSYGHLEGDVRWRRLFSATRFFLRIDGGGGVEGTRWRERPGSIVEIRSVRVGVVAIRAVHTGFYLAMNKRGRLYGSKEFSPNCKFTERIEENGYNTYASLRWRHRGRPMFLSLNSKGRPQRGGRTSRQHLSTHFLPMLVS